MQVVDYKTDYIVAGRSWTTLDDAPPKSEFKGNLDNLGRPWTARRVLQNRRLQVRFLSHLPRNAEFMGIAAPWPQPNVYALTPI